MRYLFLFSLLFCLSATRLPAGGKETLLLILAHPDDELAIAPALARLSHRYVIQTVFVTDGKGGTRVNDIPPDSLGRIRVAEAECSLRKLGLPRPIFLHADRLDSKNSLRRYWAETKLAKDSLRAILLRTAPRAIITIGPDGDTGHPEHRVVSALCTELLLREGWVDRYPLYYFLWTKRQADHFAAQGIDELMWVADRYVNLETKYTVADQERAWEAMRCHASQYTPAEIEAAIAADRGDTVRTTYFRRFVTDRSRRTGF